MPELAGFRVSDWDTPLRVNPNRSEGRFNRDGSSATQYVALHPLTPWAEYCRYHDLSPEQAEQRRLRVWAIRVIVPEIVEVEFDNATDHGLRSEDLVDDDWSACQDLADRFRTDPAGPKAIKVPSAALPGTRNIVIFGERVSIPYLWEPIDEVDMPTAIVAENARPPAGLLPLIRYRGDTHPEFDAWSQGQSFSFADLAGGA